MTMGVSYHRIQILQTDGQSDRRTEGKPKVPSSETPVINTVMKSLVQDSLSLLVDIQSSVLIFFAEKRRSVFAVQKLTFFS